ncbi:MAG: helix-turn-helix transcriptional regulator [Veillonella caviae]|uniref:helix-turn-helix domain-containing protein n=1 Tax=Veillonella caviae TaxID=248316 RepID=UPI002A911C9B|nr:helix-turn-helix transcriptional regulator [Veillonella caviae]MDY5481949.1 helix-turn-helix transcriptional regulator [Veillonella caviae]
MAITLEAARVNAGYSQKEAGELFGVHYQTIAKWEEDNTKMPFDMVKKISDIYGIEHNHIFFGSKNEFIRSLRSKLKR